MSAASRWAEAVVDDQWRLWGYAVLLYGVGDTATTVAGLLAPDTTETGPLALLAVEFGGIPAIVILKAAFVGGCFLVWRSLDTPGRSAIPLALAVTGAAVTSWNAVMLLA